MRLDLPPPPARFASPSRRAGAAAEAWAAENLYCPNCASRHLDGTPPNEKVVDFVCPRCDLRVQLKAKSSRFGRKFANSAYAPKVEAIRRRRMPDYALVRYDPDAWQVRDVEFLPGFFLTLDAIERRRPLSPTARRAGWVGSNVLLHALPPDSRVAAVREARVREPAAVRREYRRFERLRTLPARSAAWKVDVLGEVRRLAPLRGTVFPLRDLYAGSEARLAAKHPENRHVREKIRQQLQFLRDEGVLEFLPRRGWYRVRR